MLNKFSLRWQLGIGFGAVMAVFAAVLISIGYLLSGLKQSVEKIDSRDLPMVLAVDEMDLNRSTVQQFLTDVAATHDADGFKAAEESAKQFQLEVLALRGYFSKNQDSARLNELQEIEFRFNTFYALGKTMAETYVRDGMEAGNLLMKGTGTNV